MSPFVPILFICAIVFGILAIVDYAKDKSPQANAIRAVIAVVVMIFMTRI